MRVWGFGGLGFRVQGWGVLGLRLEWYKVGIHKSQDKLLPFKTLIEGLYVLCALMPRISSEILVLGGPTISATLTL